VDISNQTSDTTQCVHQAAPHLGGTNGVNSMLLSNPYLAQLTQSAAPPQGVAPPLQKQRSQSAFVRHFCATTSGHEVPGSVRGVTPATPACGAVVSPALEPEIGKGAVDMEAEGVRHSSTDKVRSTLPTLQARLSTGIPNGQHWI
jgi:hypothetical protein